MALAFAEATYCGLGQAEARCPGCLPVRDVFLTSLSDGIREHAIGAVGLDVSEVLSNRDWGGRTHHHGAPDSDGAEVSGLHPVAFLTTCRPGKEGRIRPATWRKGKQMVAENESV